MKTTRRCSVAPPTPVAGTATRPASVWLLVLCCFIVGLQPVAAQPTISVQPRDAAVVLAQEAQFTVTASGTALTYQWRLDGRELAGAINPTLTVANVALSNLGGYEVVVSNSAGAVTSVPAWLLLSRWTELVVFGRVLGEVSNCGGQVWPDYLSKQLGLGLQNLALTDPGGFNPALPSTIISDEIDLYLGSSTPTKNTLIALWSGAVDVIRGVPAEQAVSSQLALLRRLTDAGGRNFLLPTMWPKELVPFWVATPSLYRNLTSALVAEFNARLSEGLNALKGEYALTIYRPDMFTFFTAIRVNPAAYGFKVPLGSDFTCNGLNFTTAVHHLASQEFYLSLTPLLRIDSTVRTLGGDVALNWSGGVPPFRIERTTDLLSGQWESVGEPGFVSSATMKPASPQEFFRVLSLGQ